MELHSKENIETQIRHVSAPKAPAQANGFGFPKTQAGPKAVPGQCLGLAWPGFFWLGLARLLASGQSWHITTCMLRRISSEMYSWTWKAPSSEASDRRFLLGIQGLAKKCTAQHFARICLYSFASASKRTLVQFFLSGTFFLPRKWPTTLDKRVYVLCLHNLRSFLEVCGSLVIG